MNRHIPMAMAAVVLLAVATIPAQAANCEKNPDNPQCSGGGGGGGEPARPAIAYTAYRSQGQGDLYVMNADGTGATLLLQGSKFSGRSPAAEYDNSSWSPDGSALAFTDDSSSGAVFRMPVDGSSAPTALYEADSVTQPIGRVAWHPLDDWIAFGIAEDDGGLGDFDILVVPPSGGAAVNLTATFRPSANLNEDVSAEFEPSWSPTGNRMAIRRWVGSGSGAVPNRQQVLICGFSVSAESGQPALDCPTQNGDFVSLYEDEYIFEPAWHPTQDLVAYEASQIAPDGNFTAADIFIEPTGGGGPCIHLKGDRSLTTRTCETTWSLGPVMVFHSIAWSCDGQDLIMSGRESFADRPQLYLISDVLAGNATLSVLKTPEGRDGLGDVASRRTCPAP